MARQTPAEGPVSSFAGFKKFLKLPKVLDIWPERPLSLLPGPQEMEGLGQRAEDGGGSQGRAEIIFP